MKARLVEFNEDGKTLKSSFVKVRFASSDKPPAIEVILPDLQFRHRAIYISAKDLLSLILGRMLADQPAPPSDERRPGHSQLIYDKATRTIKTVDLNPPPLDVDLSGVREIHISDILLDGRENTKRPGKRKTKRE